MSFADFKRAHLACWQRLSTHSNTPNYYLSPEFIIPAQQYLTPGKQLQVATLWDKSGPLLAMGIFEQRAPGWRFPFKRLVAYHTKHSFQSGILVDQSCQGSALSYFLRQLLHTASGVQINDLRTDTRLYKQLQDASKPLNCSWVTAHTYQRAMLGRPELAWQRLSKRRHKECQRKLRRLGDLGDLQFNMVFSSAVNSCHIHSFLNNERSGTKAETALAASTEEQAFFSSLMDRAATQNQVMNCELTLDGAVIASTINFTLTDQGFAFKTANDSRYASYSPGVLIEYEFLRWCAENKPELTNIDSGAQAGSYIERLWHDRSTLAHQTLVKHGPAMAIFKLKLLTKNLLRKRA